MSWDFIGLFDCWIITHEWNSQLQSITSKKTLYISMYLPSISFFHPVFLSFSLHYLLTSYYSFSILFCPPFSFSLYFNLAAYPLRFHCLTLIISTQVKERKGRNSGEMEEIIKKERKKLIYFYFPYGLWLPFTICTFPDFFSCFI